MDIKNLLNICKKEYGSNENANQLEGTPRQSSRMIKSEIQENDEQMMISMHRLQIKFEDDNVQSQGLEVHQYIYLY